MSEYEGKFKDLAFVNSYREHYCKLVRKDDEKFVDVVPKNVSRQAIVTRML